MDAHSQALGAASPPPPQVHAPREGGGPTTAAADREMNESISLYVMESVSLGGSLVVLEHVCARIPNLFFSRTILGHFVVLVLW